VSLNYVYSFFAALPGDISYCFFGAASRRHNDVMLTSYWRYSVFTCLQCLLM